MAVQGLEGMFDEVSAEYDRWMPEYVPALFTDILSYHPIDSTSRVLEIGIGTGQATRPFLQTGCQLKAVELGERLSAYTLNKYRDFKNLEVQCLAFQDYEGPEATFDLIYSAGAFHWIPEEIGYPKVLRLLKPGGVFARFANHPDYRRGNPQLFEAIQRIYARYMPGFPPEDEYTEDRAKRRSEKAARYGFTELTYHLYHRSRTFSGQDYASLIATYSDHHHMQEPQRTLFLSEIQRTIEEAGNQILLEDTIDLQLARRPQF